ncbi:hypothetical protein OAO87_01890 [bacterium]|nr:hypothetical protein [bacterium]
MSVHGMACPCACACASICMRRARLLGLLPQGEGAHAPGGKLAAALLGGPERPPAPFTSKLSALSRRRTVVAHGLLSPTRPALVGARRRAGVRTRNESEAGSRDFAWGGVTFGALFVLVAVSLMWSWVPLLGSRHTIPPPEHV